MNKRFIKNYSYKNCVLKMVDSFLSSKSYSSVEFEKFNEIGVGKHKEDHSQLL